MELRDYIIRNITDLFNSIGIYPLYGITLIFIIILLPSIKKLKDWNSVPKHLKEFYVLGWIIGLVLLAGCIINLLHYNK